MKTGEPEYLVDVRGRKKAVVAPNMSLSVFYGHGYRHLRRGAVIRLLDKGDPFNLANLKTEITNCAPPL